MDAKINSDEDNKLLLVNDFHVFKDKKIFGKDKYAFYMGSNTYELCFSVSESIYNLLDDVEVALTRPFKIDDVYEHVKDRISYDDFSNLVTKLFELGFEANNSEISNMKKTFDETEYFMLDLLSGVPDRTNNVKDTFFKVWRYIFTFLIVAFLLFISLNLQEITRLLLKGSKEISLFPYVFAYVLSYSFHEAMHIISARSFGIKIKNISLAFYYSLIPMIYIRYKNIRFLKRSSRIYIALSGIMGNILLLLLSLVLGSYGIYNQFSSSLQYINILMILSNLLPLKLGDGYFALCDLIGVTNLRKHIWQRLLGFKNSHVLKFEPMTIIYIILTLIYYVVAIGATIISAANIWNSGDFSLKIALLVLSAFVIMACTVSSVKRICKRSRENK